MMQPVLITCLLLAPWAASAGSKLLGTGGTSSIEGSGGGGIVPWAAISSYASSGEWGATVGHARVGVDDFSLVADSFSLAYGDRLELSIARQQFWVDPLALPLSQQILGAKVKVAGELLYGALPQVSVGMQYKHHQHPTTVTAFGAAQSSGLDTYVALSKVYLDAWWGRNVLLNATLRRTSANQTGLLGFGANGHRDYQVVGEFSAALLWRHDVAVGVEFRQKPNRLAFAPEEHWRDVFVAWFVHSHASIVAGYVDLGSIAGLQQQQGYYLAVQGAF